MKKYLAMASAVLLSTTVIASSAFAGGPDVEDAMKAMNKSYRQVMKDEDAASLKTDLTALRSAAVEAQAGVPGKRDKAVFAEGMKELIDQIDVSLKLVDEGKVPEAKAEAGKLKDIMKEYHGKLGV